MSAASEGALRQAPMPLRAPWAVFPPVGSVVPILVGCLVMTGWLLDIQVLKQPWSAFVAMNPLTAGLFILSGISLGLSLQRMPSNMSRWVARAVAMVVLALAGTKLVDLALNLGLNVDGWLFASKLGGEPGGIPNRMAPNTALNFVLVSISLLSLDWPVKRFSVSQGFALLAGFGSLLPLTGYLYGVRSFQGLAAFIPMAVHTAITFLLLATGLFFAREATPLTQLFVSDDSRGVVARRLFPGVIVLTLFLGWLRITGERRGFFEPAFGTALYAISLCVLFLIVIRWTIWTVGKIEEERNSLNDALVLHKWQLEESLRQTQLIIDHARELICAADSEGKLLTMNAACEEVLSYSPGNMLGRSFVELHSPDERQPIEKAFAVAKTGMIPEMFTALCRKADATYARINWSIQWSPHYQKMFCVGRAG